jgi:hypothetical protein
MGLALVAGIRDGRAVSRSGAFHGRRVNVGIEERVSSGRCGARASETASLPHLISLALDEVDATDVHLRFGGDVNPGRDEASVTGDSALRRPDARFVAE